jgi:membrane protease YdiL (CAAX protease family)
VRKAARFLILFLVGIVVFGIGGYWAGIPPGARSALKILLPILLLLFTLACGRVTFLRPWRKVSLALFAASCGFLVSWWLIEPLLRVTAVTTDSMSGLALTKFFDSLLIVVPVLLVARAGGMTAGDLYLRRGKLRGWLVVGAGSFSIFLVLFALQTQGQGLTARQVIAMAPWTILFIFSNAFMEELHFRGLLLGPFETLLGRHPANLCIALFFTLVHAPVDYTPDIISFLCVLFALSLAWGYLIQRTGALWGSVLFHAGADLLIMADIYRTYSAS